MDAARPSNPDNLFSLQQAAKYLAVEIDVLLAWNEHDILKPIITPAGEIAYTKEQLEKFNAIQTKQIQSVSRETINTLSPSPSLTQNDHVVASPVINNYSQKQQNNYSQINNYNFYSNPNSSSLQNKKQTKSSFSFLGIVATVSFFSVAILLVFFAQHTKVNNLINEVNEKGIAYDSTNSTIRTLKSDEISPQESKLNEEGASPLKDENLALNNNDNQQGSIAADASNENENSEIVKSVVGNTNAESELITKTNTDIVTYGQKANVRESGQYNNFDENSDTVSEVFDTEGNIKVSKENPSESDLLATALGVNSFSQPQDIVKQNTGSTGVITFIILGLLFIYFIYSSRKQILPSYHSMQVAGDSSLRPAGINSQNDLQWEKLIEVDQKTDGTVVINFQGKEYRISKPEMDSESDKFIQRLMQITKSGEKEIEYDVLTDLELSTNTPLSKIVTRLGFVGLKRDLFFPRTSKTRVIFRKYLTLDDLFAMNLTIEDLSDKVDNIN